MKICKQGVVLLTYYYKKKFKTQPSHLVLNGVLHGEFTNGFCLNFPPRSEVIPFARKTGSPAHS